MGSQKERMVTGKHIEDLPNEILLEIFSYASSEDLVHSVQDVSSHWMELAHDRLLWKDKVYEVDNSRTDTEVAELLQKALELQTLNFHRPTKFAVLNALLDCQYLTKIRFSESQKLNVTFLKQMSEKCPDLEELHLHYCNICRPMGDVLGLFSNLKHLSLLNCHSNISLKCIADGCTLLQSVNLGSGLFSSHDILYFLDRIKHQLHTLHIPWSSLDGKCNIPPLLACVALKTLHITTSNKTDKIASFAALRKMSNLISLTFDATAFDDPSDIIPLFVKGGLQQLEQLTINMWCFIDPVMAVIAANCPKLKSLSLPASDVTDETLQNMAVILPVLHSLSIEVYSVSEGMPFLKKCGKLKFLEILNHHIENIKLNVLLELPMLEVCKLVSCDVSSQAISQIPTCLPHLKYLHLMYCMNVEKEILDKVQKVMPLLKVNCVPHIEENQEYDDPENDLFLDSLKCLFEF